MSDATSFVGATDSWLARAAPGLVAGGAALGIALWNPTDSGVSICASKRLLGLDCPLCGGLRCVNSLMHGHFLAAADHNLLATIAIPLVAVLWITWLIGTFTGREIRFTKPPGWVVGTGAVIVAVFTVIRNLGGPAWIEWLGSGLYG